MSRAQILIVEDDPSLLEGIRTILELDQYDVLPAENGLHALEILKSAAIPPDLIVSDIMMPHMDGIEFLGEVRKEPRWVSIPFIFLTAKSDKSDLQKGKRLGVDDYLVKPFEAEDLLIAVEARLKRQQALNEVQAGSMLSLKRNILTILNHEFRTPLTFVVAYADMLNTHNTTELSDTEMLQFLKGVGSGATRLRRLIENFILLVELETGDAIKTYEWRRAMITDADKLLRAACERVMSGEGVEHPYSVWLPDKLPSFDGDYEFLVIALSQLVSNAIKFSASDKPFMIGAHSEADEVHLWVRDQGRGIPETELQSIWESFYQINREILEDQGTGSGLTIVHGIATMHGGRVEVESQPGIGSKFTIILPL
jgi:two-component system, sensor histidine kinase and response regulator